MESINFYQKMEYAFLSYLIFFGGFVAGALFYNHIDLLFFMKEIL